MKKSNPSSSHGFVPLKALTKGPADPQTALAEIRHIYFNTTRQTIVHDFDHAIELLKALDSEEQREKATVYMEGLAQMRNDWEREPARKAGRPKGAAPRQPAKRRGH